MATEKPMTTDDGAKGMNIRDHIEAGHYPTDDKGRALVKASDGATVVIAATDMPGGCPILGFRLEGASGHGDCGFGYWADTKNLLPPPPRKVKVRFGLILRDGMAWGLRDTYDHALGQVMKIGPNGHTHQAIDATIEYEEPWS